MHSFRSARSLFARLCIPRVHSASEAGIWRETGLRMHGMHGNWHRASLGCSTRNSVFDLCATNHLGSAHCCTSASPPSCMTLPACGPVERASPTTTERAQPAAVACSLSTPLDDTFQSAAELPTTPQPDSAPESNISGGSLLPCQGTVTTPAVRRLMPPYVPHHTPSQRLMTRSFVQRLSR